MLLHLGAIVNKIGVVATHGCCWLGCVDTRPWFSEATFLVGRKWPKKDCPTHSASRKPQVNYDWAVVAAAHSRPGIDGLHAIRNPLRYVEGVDAPPDVLGSRVVAIAPECVAPLMFFRILLPVYIDKAAFLQEFSVGISFLRGESRRLEIRLGIRQVDLCGSDVEVAAPNNRFLCVEFLDEFCEFPVPVHAVVEPLETHPGVGHVSLREGRKRCEKTPFRVINKTK
jgi:hypothetical protein